MNKPNITEGEWYVRMYTNYSGWSVYSSDYGCVAERWGNSEEQAPNFKANAKAISAVPDMIDALIEVRELVIWCNRHFPQWELKLDRIEKALEKAGVKFDE